MVTNPPVNPYIAGNPVGGSPAFVGRDDVLREVHRILRRPQDNAILLYGQRRIGKTSILMHLAVQLPGEGKYHPVYFDLQDKTNWSPAQILSVLACTVAHTLGQPDPELAPDPEKTFRDDWLPVLLAGLPTGCSLVLLFDEFDVLEPETGQAARAFFSYLRTLLADNRERLQFVFVIGRNVKDLDIIALSLFKGTPYRHVSLLSREDTVTLVRLSEANHTLHWPDETVECVWQWTCGHPFLTQQLCSHVWEQAYDKEPPSPPTVHPNDVNDVVSEALAASRSSMEWLWNGLGPPERVVASALAEAGPTSITRDQLTKLLQESGVRTVIQELQDAPQLLQEWDLIRPMNGSYRFRVELMRRWIADYKPLYSVQKELDRINPVAENYYQAALGLYRLEQLERALDPLRQAVALNPNHVGANQLLADILIAQGELQEARALLDPLYEYQPAIARPRLVQVLLALAQSAGSDDEKLGLYERVLALDPGRQEAIAGQARILRARELAAVARSAFAAEEWPRAIEALSEIAQIDVHYSGVQDLLKKAQKHQRAQARYEMGLNCLQARHWTRAIEEFQAALEDNPDHSQALDRLEIANRQENVENLARVADEYQERAEWGRVVETLEKLLSLQSPELDVDWEAAGQRLDQAQTEHKLALLYRDGLSHMESKQWHRALSRFEQVQKRQPSYREVAARIRESQIQIALEELYRRASAYERARKWSEAQALYEQIAAQEHDYMDVVKRIDLCARRQETRSRIGQGVRFAAVAASAVLILIAAGTVLTTSIPRFLNPTPTALSTTAALMLPPTTTPTPYPTYTLYPTYTPLPTATDVSTPTSTPASTPTGTPAPTTTPTVMPTFTVADQQDQTPTPSPTTMPQPMLVGTTLYVNVGVYDSPVGDELVATIPKGREVYLCAQAENRYLIALAPCQETKPLGWADTTNIEFAGEFPEALITPSATPTPALQPILLAPPDGATLPPREITFEWTWYKELAENEIHSLRIWPRESGAYAPCVHVQATGSRYVVSWNTNLCPGTDFCWQVQPLGSNERGAWTELTAPSETWCFAIETEP